MCLAFVCMTHMSRAGGFRVDLERAPEAIRELEFAVAELREIQNDAKLLAKPDPGSRDSVSVEAAQRIGLAAGGGPTSLVEALEIGIRQVDALIMSLKSDLAAYRSAESSGAGRFDAGRA